MPFFRSICTINFLLAVQFVRGACTSPTESRKTFQYFFHLWSIVHGSQSISYSSRLLRYDEITPFKMGHFSRFFFFERFQRYFLLESIRENALTKYEIQQLKSAQKFWIKLQLCNPKSCNKCAKIASRDKNRNENCQRLFKIKNCCPINVHMLTRGF